MLDTGIEILKSLIEELRGTGSYTVFYLVAIIYFIAYKKENIVHDVVLYYVVLCALVIFNPITAYVIGNKFFDETTYFYLMWSMPVGIIIAYMYTDLLFNSTSKIKIILGIVLVGLITFYVGGYYYGSNVYAYQDNSYKIISNSQEEILDFILNENLDKSEIKVYIEPELNKLARIYSNKFIVGYYKVDSDSYDGDYDPLIKMQNTFEYEQAVKEIVDNGYSYLIWNDNSLDLTKSGLLENVYSNQDYQIYKVK